MTRDALLKLCLVLIALAIALAFRLPRLGERPFHGDEANQAMKTGVLLETGRYEYDPHEHHGPTLYYGELVLLKLLGVPDIEHAREWMFRLMPALFGAATVLLVLLMPGLGALEAGLAAFFIAVSHAMVYYSRYYVQESLFVFFAFLAFVALLRLLQRPSWVWAIPAGLAIGLTYATKETSVILFAAMGLALLPVMYKASFSSCHSQAPWLVGAEPPELKTHPQAKALVSGTKRVWLFLVVASLVALGVSITLYSSFFTHWRGVPDSVLTYSTYLHRAEGEGSTALHDKPWWYYFALLVYTHREAGPHWSEAFALGLAVVGLMRVFYSAFRIPHSATPLTIYALLVAVVFGLIPYKTPWNLLPFWMPLLVLAGVGAAWLLGSGGRIRRVSVALVLAAGFGHAAYQTWQGNFVYAADTRNPYVYAHTSTALLRLGQRVEDLAAVSPDGKAMHINVLKPDADYWPLPWYLRGYTTVGYWTKPPEDADADVIIADASLGEFVKSHTTGEYQFEFAALRPGVNLLVFIRKPLWDAFMETRK